MTVYVVVCETSFGHLVVADVKKVFSNEEKADQYTEKQNKMYHNSYCWIEEREVE